MNDEIFETWYSKIYSKMTRREARFYSERILCWVDNFVDRGIPDMHETRRLCNLCRNLELPVLELLFGNLYLLIKNNADGELIDLSMGKLKERSAHLKGSVQNAV